MYKKIKIKKKKEKKTAYPSFPLGGSNSLETGLLSEAWELEGVA